MCARPERAHADGASARSHAASVRQTALFEVAGTGALTAWQAPAGYWPTDGAEGGVCRGGQL